MSFVVNFVLPLIALLIILASLPWVIVACSKEVWVRVKRNQVVEVILLDPENFTHATIQGHVVRSLPYCLTIRRDGNLYHLPTRKIIHITIFNGDEEFSSADIALESLEHLQRPEPAVLGRCVLLSQALYSLLTSKPQITFLF